jgi:hypothetical protein
MINHFINKLISELFKLIVSELNLTESRFFVNSVNDHIIKKILNLNVIDHIFCN